VESQLPGDLNGMAGRYEYRRLGWGIDSPNVCTRGLYQRNSNTAMIPKPIPLRSLYDLPPLSWKDIEYGYAHQLMGWRTITDIAVNKVEQGSANPLELELAGVGKDTDWKISDLVHRLANGEPPQGESEVAEKWLFVALKWLYENRSDFQNPLREVEEIYAEFDYPSAVSQFVGFLPPANGYRPESHTPEENQQRLYDLWAAYLRATAMRLLSKPQ